MRLRAGPSAAALGACAAGLTLTLSLLLRALVGLPSLGETIGNGLVLLLPGSLFGLLIDALQEKGRPLLLLGSSVLVILLGALLGWLLGRWSWIRVAPRPASPARRRGRALLRWLLPAGVLWILTLPLVALGEGSLAVSNTWASLADWLLLAGLAELLLGLPQTGGSWAGPAAPAAPGESSRRRFLAGAGALLGAAGIGYLGWNVLRASAPPLPRLAPPGPGPRQLPGEEGLTPVSDFYVVSKDLFGPPQVDAASWRLAVGGERPFSLGYQQLLAQPHVTQVQTLECISNPVGGTLISTGSWSGVRLPLLLDRAGVPGGAREIVFQCADGYGESLPLDQAMAPTTLVADHLNGRPLTAQHGFPARILVLGHYGMKNPKWLTSITPSSRPFTGYWEEQGWAAGAYPRIFSRFDFPGGNSSLRPGHRYLLRGIAYAASRGISSVELSLDGGRRWFQAELERPLSPYTWRVWYYPWRPASGFYTMQVRARDGRGRLQPPGDGQTFPRGANGYQEIIVLVR